MSSRKTKRITVELDETIVQLLSVLGEPTNVIMQLVDHATQGVYRPGAWERQWVTQVFGNDFESQLKPGDPWNREVGAIYFQRPRRTP